jgi:hypothetical protein
MSSKADTEGDDCCEEENGSKTNRDDCGFRHKRTSLS